MTRILLKAMIALLAIMAGTPVHSQNKGCDVFVPIAKYMGQGDAESLSAWFADNLEISVGNGTGNSSKNQARQILKSFFNKSVPTAFSIEHTASRGNMKYALGTLNCGAESHMVTIFVSYQNNSYRIQQLKIEKAR